jgi:NADH-quinone oxidoreductase subunit L
MTIPMIVLAFGSVFAGGLFSLNSSFLKWLEPVTGHAEGHSPVSAGTVTAGTMVVLVLGAGLAWLMYGRRPVPRTAPRGSLLTRAARRDLLQDDFNHVVLVRGGEHLTRSLVYLDHSVVDGVVNGTAASVGGLSGRMRRLQNGYVRSYAVSMLGGTAVLIAATLLMRGVA